MQGAIKRCYNFMYVYASLSTDDVFISRYEWRAIIPTNGTSHLLICREAKRRTVTGWQISFTFELLVEDNGWGTARDTVTITVN